MGVRSVLISGLVAVSVVLVGGATPAQALDCAYTGRRHKVIAPDVRDIEFTLCREHFSPGSDAMAAVEYVVEELNAVQGSRLKFSILGHDDHREYHDVLKRDGKIRLDVVKPEATKSGDAAFAGRTMTRSGRGGIREFDIVFNRRSRFNFGPPVSWAMKAPRGSFRSILFHEIGHGLGFSHSHQETECLSVMGGKCGKWIGNKRAGLKAWDHGHIHFHYAARSSAGKPDLVLSNYRTNKTPKGSWRTGLNQALSQETVAPGEELTIAWTRFNTGPALIRGGYRVRIYLSRDETPGDAQDHLVHEWVAEDEVVAASTAYLTTTLTLGSDVPAGSYYVGIVIDAGGDVEEALEDNNSLVLHQRLQVAGRQRTRRRV